LAVNKESNKYVIPDSAVLLDRSRGVFFLQWEELLRLRRTVLKTSHHDDIHDLRVATRRFRAAVELFYPFAPKGIKIELKKQIRKLTRALGDVRNIDEALLFFSERIKDDGIRKKLCQTLSGKRTGEVRSIQKKLIQFDSDNLDKPVREIIAGMDEKELSTRNRFSYLAYFSNTSIKLYLPIHQLLSTALTPENIVSRHNLRIAIKKWRYFLEIVSMILERDYSCLLEQLKEYQSVLGKMNDLYEFDTLIDENEFPDDERKHFREILAAENVILLDQLIELKRTKPLTYTFLI